MFRKQLSQLLQRMRNNYPDKHKRTDRLFISRSCLLAAMLIASLVLVSCKRYEPAAVMDNWQEFTKEADLSEVETETETQPESTEETEPEIVEEPDTRVPAKVKALYLASKPVGNTERMDKLIEIFDKTELNAVVIDIKDDYGKITYNMQNVPAVVELESIESCIDDLPGLIRKFKEHDIYCIARIVTMRDPHLARVKPEWMLTRPDGTIYKDNSGYTWINPYNTEYWKYIKDIAIEAGRAGFQEIQFDYFRFCTDKGADDCLWDEELIRDRDKISLITELAEYLHTALKEEGLFMACDVFGTIIRSKLDSRSVGQSYEDLACIIDYMCPMVYPSHYANGNFGLDHPDLYPYEAILGALKRSRSALSGIDEDTRIATVRPWLQAFTATWLGSGNYKNYDAAAIRDEIRAVYDAGYDEWILWSPSVTYDYDGFLSASEGEAERIRIEESRAAMPVETEAVAAETFPKELEEALNGDELSPEDESKLLLDGPIITYE